MKTESPGFERSGFSVCYWLNIGAPLHVLAHEMGHNMGCAYNRAKFNNCAGECICKQGACAYSFGYNLPPEDPSYRTIMAAPVGGDPRIPHFSNPDVNYPTFAGYPTGEAPPSCNSADNATTIDETAETVTNFRASCDTTDTTAMASADFFVGQANDGNREVSISDNGQYMAFTSDATVFISEVPGEPEDEVSDVYLYNRESGLVRLLSKHRLGVAGEGPSYAPVISGNGRYTAYASDSADLVASADDLNEATDIYLSRQFQDTPVRVSLTSSGTEADGNSISPSISRDAQYVAFASDATNLIGACVPPPHNSGDCNALRDIFVRDRVGSTTTRVSVSTDPLDRNPDGHSYAPAIGPDGRYIAFESDATNLLEPGLDTLGHRDIFVRDNAAADTVRVSVSSTGEEANGPSYAAAISISGTGQFVVFESDATNLVPGDNNGYRDIFVRRLLPLPLVTIRVSVGSGGESDADSYAPAISADGNYVVFHSVATNLVGGGIGGLMNVYLYNLQTGQTSLVSMNSSGQAASGGGSFAPAVSADGRFIAFESDATNLVPVQQIVGYRDIFFRDRG